MKKGKRRKPDYQLAFDPTPAGLITASLRKSFEGVWARLRREHFATHDLSCEICSTIATERRYIHGHEVWSFPDAKTIRLERVIFICVPCHDTIHFERSRSRAQEPYVRALEAHYCKLRGGLSEAQFRQDVKDATHRMFAIRDQYHGKPRPTFDYGPFADLVAESARRKAAWQDNQEEDDGDGGDFELLPDHEYPWVTAMWRDTFSIG